MKSKKFLFLFCGLLLAFLFLSKTSSLAQTPTTCPGKPYELRFSVSDYIWGGEWPGGKVEGASGYVQKTSGASSTTGKCYSRWDAWLDIYNNYTWAFSTVQMFCNCDNVGFKAYNQKTGCPDVESDEVKVNFGISLCTRADFNFDNEVNATDQNTFNSLYASCLNCTPWTCNWSTCGKADLNRDGKIDGYDGIIMDECSGRTFCWCTYAPPPTPTPVSIKVEGYKRNEGNNSGLPGATIEVQKIDNLNCTGNHFWCTPASVTSANSGYWTSTCIDGPMKSILIKEKSNPAGYTDGTKWPLIPAGCTVWDVNTVCCNMDGKTSLGGKITFYNKAVVVLTPTPISTGVPTPTPTSASACNSLSALRTFIYRDSAVPWWQTIGGDTHGEVTVSSLIPACAAAPYLSLPGEGGSAGVVSYGTSVELGAGEVSENGWLAKTNHEGSRLSFDYLVNRLKAVETDNFNETLAIPSGTYYQEGDVNLTDGFPSGAKIVLFVHGNVLVEQDVVVEEGGFFALISSGNITFASAVENAQGFYLADGTLTVAAGGAEFAGAGSFVSWEGISLNRDLGTGESNCSPAETFTERPDFYINAPDSFRISDSYFKEVVP